MAVPVGSLKLKIEAVAQLLLDMSLSKGPLNYKSSEIFHALGGIIKSLQLMSMNEVELLLVLIKIFSKLFVRFWQVGELVHFFPIDLGSTFT